VWEEKGRPREPEASWDAGKRPVKVQGIPFIYLQKESRGKKRRTVDRLVTQRKWRIRAEHEEGGEKKKSDHPCGEKSGTRAVVKIREGRRKKTLPGVGGPRRGKKEARKRRSAVAKKKKKRARTFSRLKRKRGKTSLASVQKVFLGKKKRKKKGRGRKNLWVAAEGKGKKTIVPETMRGRGKLAGKKGPISG